MKSKKRALISVSDKTGLIPLAKALQKNKYDILSTGGTLKALKTAGVKVTAVDSYTQFPEMMEGRVKTLHPKIHGGLLYRRDKKSHTKEAKKHGIDPIDVVVVNLYPFEEVTKNPKVDFATAIENIDIGGPSMLRSAAKNFKSVTVVTDPADYERVIKDLKKSGKVSASLRQELAGKVFARTFAYDQAIANFLESRAPKKKSAKQSKGLPNELNVPYQKVTDLRYGENPHQRAALYTRYGGEGKLHYKQLHGKELSYNNLLDIEGTIDTLREFDEPAGAVIKHSNPCGAAIGANITIALKNAIACDPKSAFGGIVGVNRKCDLKTAQMAFKALPFFEVFIAPSFEAKALEFMKQRKNMRLIETGELGAGGPYDLRFLKSGVLVQDRDKPLRLQMKTLKKNLKCVTKKKPTKAQLEDLLFGFKCVKIVKSNAIVLAKGKSTVGIGAGQMSRVDSVEIACHKAGKKKEGSVLASDAFFPMPDSIDFAKKNKIKAIIQPGGSIKDQEVIDACNKYGIAMVFTGQRHFRH